MLTLEDIIVRFGDRVVLDGVNLSVGRGEIVALQGPSGSGKSTLLRVAAGLMTPDQGRVVVDGRDVTSTAPHRRRIGMVFQDNQLFAHMTVAENVSFGLRMNNVPAATRHRRVDDMLSMVGLDGVGGRDVTTLSGGEAKRVALARSLAPEPLVLLLDEPLTGLDESLHDRLMAELRVSLLASKTTALIVTHDHREAATLADRVTTLE